MATPNDPIQPLGLVGQTPQPIPVIGTVAPTPKPFYGGTEFEPIPVAPSTLKPINPEARELVPYPADPFAQFEDAPANFDQFQDAPAAPDAFASFKNADDLDTRSVDELNLDREKFNPVTYFSENPDAANDPAKLAKLLAVYRKRREEGLKAGEVAKAAVKETPGLVKNILGGVKRLGERAIDVTVQPIANVILGTLTGDLFDNQKRDALFNETSKVVRKGVGEVAAGSESATVGLVDLTRQGARKLPQFGKDYRTEFEPLPEKKPATDQELLQDLADDASFRQTAAEILTGQGEAAKNFGLDKESLAKEGIELDEKAIEQLSLVDPITMVATAGAFKLVGVGGKILGTARTLEGAKKITEKLAGIAKLSAGKTVQAGGKVVGGTGKLLKGSGAGLGTIAGISTAVSGGGITPALLVGGGARLVGPAMRKVGPAIEHAGKAIAGEVPVSASLQKVIDYAKIPGRAAAEVGKGAFTGIAAAAPFAVMADEDATAGALFGAGAALGAGHATGAGAFRVVKQGASRRYFGENRPVLEDVPSPGYGKDAALDSAHESNIQKLSAQDAAELNNFREALRQQGGEIYALDRPTFRQKLSEVFPDASPETLDIYENHSAFFDQNLGDRKVVYLNSDTTGLQHDAGHIFDAILSDSKRKELRAAVEQAFTPEQRKQFRDTYERRVGNKITDEAAIDEFIAEQFAALFNNVPVTELAAPKSLLTKFIDTVAEGAEALGIDVSAGATSPELGAPVAVGIRKLFQNAAGDVIRANIEGVPPSNVVPLFPEKPATPVTPPTAPPATPTPPANVTPLPTGRNIRVTPEQVSAFSSTAPEARAAAAARAAETGVDYARTEAKKNEGSPTSKIIEQISDSMETGNPVLGIEHLGITSESTPAAPAGRTTRRGEQAAGYTALEAAQLDVRQNAPPEIVSQHSKNFVPVRWTNQGGTPTLIAMSLDKVISNILKVAADPKAKDLIPYPVENGKLTAQGWREVVADAQAYSENQANGRKGDGGRLEVPETGLSIPVENPTYTPKPLSPERANFQNLVQGLAPPRTARTSGTQIPGNVKGQILAEANRRAVELPVNIPAKSAGKQAFVDFPPRVVQEVNPLRNALEARGVKTRELIEVTERIRAQDIVSATPRPEVAYRAPVTDVIRGGFLPNPEEFKAKTLQGQTVDEFARKVISATPEEWKAATDNMTGGLTGGAWNLGLGLTDPTDVPKLLSYHKQLSDASRTAMLAGEFDSAMSIVARGQFFREAYEAATGTGSAKTAFEKGRLGDPNAAPPFPFAEKTKATAATSGDTTIINIGETGQFLPAEELFPAAPESAEPELRVATTARPARPLNFPPTRQPLIPPPVAAGFLPATESEKDFQTEKKFAEDYLKGEVEFKDIPYLKDYEDSVAKESKLLPPNSKVAFIGSGPVPISPILLERAGHKVTGLDSSPEAIDLGKKVAGKSGDKISLEHAAGEGFDFSKFDAAFVSLEAGKTPSERQAVFDKLSSLPEGARVLVRRSKTPDFSEAAFSVPGFKELGRTDVFGGLSETVAFEKTSPSTVEDAAGFLPKKVAQETIPPEDIQRFKNRLISDMGNKTIITIPEGISQDFVKNLTPEDFPQHEGKNSTETEVRIVKANGKQKSTTLYGVGEDFIRDLKGLVGVKTTTELSKKEFFAAEPPKTFSAEEASKSIAEGRGYTAPMAVTKGRNLEGSGWLFRDGKAIEVEAGEYHDDTVNGLNAAGRVDARNPETFQSETGAIRLGTTASSRAITDYGNADLGISLSRKPSGPQRIEIIELLKNLSAEEGNPYFNRVSIDITTEDGNIYGGRNFRYPEQRGEIARFLTDPFSKEFEAEAGGAFLPRTEAGRKLEERGFEIESTGQLGIRRVAVRKDGEEVAVIQSVQRSPERAEIAMVQKYAGAPKGVGEVLYRELGSQLQADGVKLVEGNVISPEPLAIRRKVFGEFKSLDVNAEPATYEQALATAERIRNQTEREVAAIEPVSEISSEVRFLPKVKRDSQGRPLDKEGNIDYARWQKEGIAARKKREAEPIAAVAPRGPVSAEAGNATGWILPDKKFVPLESAYHEQYLADNSEVLNKKFNTNFSDVSSPDDRLAALNAGFIRLRNQNGRLTVEANAGKWSSLKSQVLRTLQDREGAIDSLSLSLLNDSGQQVDSTSASRLHEMDAAERMDAIADAVGTLRSSGARFLPTEEGLPGIGIPSVEEAGRLRAKRRIATVKKNNPEAVLPQYARDEAGEIIIKPDGTPKALTLDYDLVNSPVAKEAAKGLKGAAREEAAGKALGEKLAKLHKSVEKNPDIIAGAKWYSTARTRLKKMFGDDAKLFAELLGATSARTPVETNYRFALDAYNQFKAGAFDKTLAKYREGKNKWEAGDIDDFLKATKAEEPTRGQFIDWWVKEHDLGVTQASGKKYGMNSRAVLRVLDGSWAAEVQGPKTPNFAGNLTGETFEATIDVWAARLLHRLASEGGKDRWRILPENETGVTDADFYLGQAAYRNAAKQIGIKPDALQAILWFAEKEHWEKNGWTRGAGAEKSDFNVLLAETERTPEGKLQMKTPQIGLDFGASLENIVKKKR